LEPRGCNVAFNTCCNAGGNCRLPNGEHPDVTAGGLVVSLLTTTPNTENYEFCPHSLRVSHLHVAHNHYYLIHPAQTDTRNRRKFCSLWGTNWLLMFNF